MKVAAWVRRFLRFGRRRWDGDINDEIEFHLDSLADEYRRSGMKPDEARRKARREFGAVAGMKEEYRDKQSLPLLESLLIDAKQAFRQLIQHPRVSIIAVLALAVGIGTTTAIYSVTDAIILRPLPYPDSGRMVRLQRVFPQGIGPAMSVPKYAFIRDHAKTLQHVAAFSFAGPGWNLSGGTKPEQVRGIFASSQYFEAFGTKLVLGRTYQAAEDRPGGPNVAVLSYGLWKRRFNGDPDLVGKSIALNEQLFTVIGVLKPFAAWPRSELWVPLRIDPNDTNPAHYLNCVAHLKPGVTADQAAAEMETLAAQYKSSHPTGFGDKEAWRPFSLQETLVGDTKGLMAMLMAAVVLLLLIASANVANLLLARSIGRQREIAIRMAIGAGAGRVVRQILTECVLMSLVAAILGTILGLTGIKALLALVPGDLPRQEELTIAGLLHWRSGAFAVAVSVLTGILFGMAPAFQLSDSNVSGTLKDSARSLAGGGHRRLRSLLVATEIGLSAVLLIGAGLLFRSYTGLRHVDPGFDPKNLTVLSTSLGGSRYQKTSEVAALMEQSMTRLEASPGITAVGMSYSALLEGSPDIEFRIEGRPLDSGKRSHGDSNVMPVGGHYFEAAGIPLRFGRLLGAGDRTAAPRVAVINEAFAKQFFPDQQPVGQRILIGPTSQFGETPREIVGISGNVRQNGLDSGFPPVIYFPVAQSSDSMTALLNRVMPLTWMVRSPQPLPTVVEVAGQAIRSTDSHLAMPPPHSMAEAMAATLARQNFQTLLASILGGFAILLAAIGLYAVISYMVEQQTKEIGIRIALGAAPSEIVKQTVLQSGKLALAGITTGVIAALGFTRFLKSLLVGVTATDPATIGAVALLLGAVCALASYWPARKAGRTDPLVTLRTD